MSAITTGRRNWSAGRFLSLAASLVLVLSPASVLAQNLKPLEIEPDLNGIDLLQGKTRGNRPVLSVPGSGNLRFDRVRDYHLKATGVVSQDGGGRVTVETGATSESFDCPEVGGVCLDIAGRGSTLKGNVFGNLNYMEGGSGKRVLYTVKAVQTSGSGQSEFTTYASQITYPNGESISISYYTDPTYQNAKRPTTLTSSLGYQIRLTYQSSNILEMGWQNVASASIHRLDPSTGIWGAALSSLTYTETANGTVVTDDLGRQTTTTASDSTGGTGFQSGTRYQLPGESTDQLLVTSKTIPVGTGQFTGVGTVKRDGMTYQYDYTVDGYNSPAGSWLISQVRISGPESYSRVVNIDPLIAGAPNPITGGSGVGRPALVRSIKNSQGYWTYYDYDTVGWNLRKVTYPEGNSIEVTRDAIGNITERRQKAKPTMPAADIVERATYPGGSACDFPELRTVTCFRPTSTFDALNNETKYTYTSGGLLQTQLSPPDASGVRSLLVRTYSGSRVIEEEVCKGNASANPIDCGTATSRLKTYTYWGSTMLPATETVSDGLGGNAVTTTYSYDDAGNVLSIDGPLPGADDMVYFRYDAGDRKIWEIGPKSETGTYPATKTDYRDADDQPSAVYKGYVIDPAAATLAFTQLSKVTTAYDSKRLARTVQAYNGTTKVSRTDVSYDAANREQCKAVRINASDFGSATNAACTPQTSGAEGIDRITRTYYDSEGRTTKLVQGYGSTLQRDYATYSYTNNGKLASMTDARGYRAEMRYDGFDRQTHWYFPSKTATGAINTADYEYYIYDAAGNRTDLRKRDGTVLKYAYDNLNRVKQKTVPSRSGLSTTHTRDVFYTYDVFGQPIRTSFDSTSGEGQIMTYDILGRPTSEKYYDGSTTRTLTSGYDVAGNRTSLKFPDNKTFTYSYGSGGQFDQAMDPSATLLFDFNYDNSNRLTQLARDSVAPEQDFAYDGLDRLTSLGWANAGTKSVSWSYTRNPANQIRTETQSNDIYSWDGYAPANRAYATNGLNQYTTVAGKAFCYDANGNLTADDQYAYLYDVENRLVEMRARVGTTCPATYTGQLKASLRYDPLGRLVDVTNYINGVSQGATRFLHDGDALVAEYDASGTILARHIHGPAAGADDPMVSYAGSSVASTNAKFLYADPRGSVVFTSNRAGTTQAIMTYDSWGVPGTGAATFSRFGYTGQVWLSELGMNYYKARIYSPSLGRFLQTDPIGYEDQNNLYVYVANDPVNNVDPDGRQSVPGTTAVICGGSSACWDQHNQARADIGAAAIAFLFGDITTAARNPTPMNIAIAAVGLTPVGKGVTVLKAGGKFVGNAQRTLRAGQASGHAFASARAAREMITSGKYVKDTAYLNKQLRTITGGKVDSALRPDVAAVRPDGKVDITEVLSGNQSARSLQDKYTNALGDRMGTFRAIEPTKQVCIGSRIARTSC